MPSKKTSNKKVTKKPVKSATKKQPNVKVKPKLKKPAKPVKKAKAAKPAKPIKKAKAAKPSKPAKKVEKKVTKKPVKTAKPAKAVKPVKTAKPAKKAVKKVEKKTIKHVAKKPEVKKAVVKAVKPEHKKKLKKEAPKAEQSKGLDKQAKGLEKEAKAAAKPATTAAKSKKAIKPPRPRLSITADAFKMDDFIEKISQPLVKTSDRKYFSTQIDKEVQFPALIEIQLKSYKWLLEDGLRELLDEISPITDFSGKKLELHFLEHSIGQPKYSPEEAKSKNITFEAPLKVHVQLINKETGEIKEQDVFLGSIPLMTGRGTFIINGIERVVV